MYNLAAVVNWGIFAYNFFSLGTLVSLDSLGYPKMLSDSQSKWLFDKLKFVYIAVMVNGLFI